jgi:hypothetical protein
MMTRAISLTREAGSLFIGPVMLLADHVLRSGIPAYRHHRVARAGARRQNSA